MMQGKVVWGKEENCYSQLLQAQQALDYRCSGTTGERDVKYLPSAASAAGSELSIIVLSIYSL